MLVRYPLATEKAINSITMNNTLVFEVDMKATKKQIKDEIESRFGVKVEKVNVVITTKGKKKAYVKLAKGFSADELAARLKVI